MDQPFYHSRQLKQAELRQLINSRSDGPALRRFGVQYALMLSSASLVALAPSLFLPLWLMLTAMLIFAFMTMSLFAIVHETGHNTAFASRKLNRLGLWLAGTPIYYTPTGFKEFHFAHHRYTHHPARDPEISFGGKPMPDLGSGLIPYLGFVSGQPLMQYKILMLMAAAIGTNKVWSGFLTFVSPRSRQALNQEARLILVIHALWIISGIFWLPGLLWLLLAQALGHCFLSFYLITEHTGLAHSGSILARTRTTLSTPLMRWLMWNMPYHSEHHAYPAVPWHALPALHQLLQHELRYVQTGYTRFHQRALSSLIQNKRFNEDPESG